MKPIDLMELLDELPEEDIAEELDYQPIPKRRTFLVSKPFLAGASTAACLLAVVGLSVSVWSRQQKIETKPSQETQTTTVTQTETRTEATAQITTEPQTTLKPTETSRKVTESTALSAIVTNRVQLSTAESVHLTTTSKPETAVSVTIQTDTVVRSSQQYSSTAIIPHTELSQTSRTARIPAQNTYVSQTFPTTSTPIVTTAPPQSATDSIHSEATEPPHSIVTETSVSTDSTVLWEPPTSTLTSTSSLNMEVFKGFYTTPDEQISTNWHIEPISEDDDPQDYSLQYTIDGTEFQNISLNFNERYYSFLSENGQNKLFIGQKLRSTFSFTYIPDEYAILREWGDCPGFILETSDGWCNCIWDDGNYIMTAGCYQQDIPLLKKFHLIDE